MTIEWYAENMEKKELVVFEANNYILRADNIVVGDIVKEENDGTIVLHPDSHRTITSIRIDTDEVPRALFRDGGTEEISVITRKELSFPNEIFIYGRSDDIVRVDGSLEDSFTLPSSDEAVLKVNNKRAIKITYDGEWKISPINWDVGEKVKMYTIDSEYADIFCDSSQVVRVGLESPDVNFSISK